MLRSYKEQAEYGLPVERRIAVSAMTLLYPARSDVSLFRMPPLAKVDFLVLTKTRVLAALEVKRRSVTSSRYRTTILPQTVVDFAERFAMYTGRPTYAAILFVDGLYVFDVLEASTPCYLRTRRGSLRKHREYTIRKEDLYAA